MEYHLSCKAIQIGFINKSIRGREALCTTVNKVQIYKLMKRAIDGVK
jgi:hypothetical protein